MHIMKFLKLGKKKAKEHERLLLEEYNRGRILQVDGKTDNKEYFKSLEVENEPTEESE